MANIKLTFTTMTTIIGLQAPDLGQAIYTWYICILIEETTQKKHRNQTMDSYGLLKVVFKIPCIMLRCKKGNKISAFNLSQSLYYIILVCIMSFSLLFFSKYTENYTIFLCTNKKLHVQETTCCTHYQWYHKLLN